MIKILNKENSNNSVSDLISGVKKGKLSEEQFLFLYYASYLHIIMGKIKRNKNLIRNKEKNTKLLKKSNGVNGILESLESKRKRKQQKINEILKQKIIDISELQEAARSQFGLVTRQMRQRVWPILLNLEIKEKLPSKQSSLIKKQSSLKQFAEIDNIYEEQVQRDVDRSLIGFTEVDYINDNLRENKRKALKMIIMAVISKNNYHYFQGFNVFSSIFLMVLGRKIGFYATESASKYILKDLFYDSFDKGLNPLLHILKALIQKLDPKIYELLAIIEQPTFAVPWILTWFSHNLRSLGDISRIYDFCLASHPLAIVYLSAATIIQQKKRLPDLEFIDRDEVLPCIHVTFQSMQLSSQDIEDICLNAANYMKIITPAQMTTMFWRTIPPLSPLIHQPNSLGHLLCKNKKYTCSVKLPDLLNIGRKTKIIRFFSNKYIKSSLAIIVVLLAIYYGVKDS